MKFVEHVYATTYKLKKAAACCVMCTVEGAPNPAKVASAAVAALGAVL
jgi:hypothetical protein